MASEEVFEPLIPTPPQSPIPMIRPVALTQTLKSFSQYKPLVRLETVSAAQLRFIFGVLYVALAGSVAILVVQDTIRQQSMVEQPNFVRSDSNQTTFQLTNRFNVLQLYFSTFLLVEREPQTCLNRTRILCDSFPESDFRFNVSSFVYALDPRTSENLLLSNTRTRLRVVCGEESPSCALSPVVYPSDYQTQSERVPVLLDTFTTRLVFDGLSLENESLALFYDHDSFSRVKFKFKTYYNDILYRMIELAMHGMFGFGSVCLLLLWITKICRSRNTIVAEQYWITFLLVAVFLYQGPLYIPSISAQRRIYRVLSDSGQIISVGSFLLYSLLILSSIRQTARKELKGNHLDFHKFPCSFYLPKILLSASFVTSSIVASIHFEEVFSSNSVHNHLPFSIPAAISILAGFALMIWIIFSMSGTSRVLRKLPYIQTRFRQLTFRYFIFQITLVFVFLFISFLLFIERVVTKTVLTDYDSRSASLPEFLLLSVYCYVLVFIYSPVPDSETDPGAQSSRLRLTLANKTRISRSDWAMLSSRSADQLSVEWRTSSASADYSLPEDFSFKTALVLLDFAFAAYSSNPFESMQFTRLSRFNSFDSDVDPTTIEDRASEAKSEFNVELSQYGFRILLHHHNNETDTNCYVAKREEVVVISFRGTASLTNARTDLWMSQSSIRLSDEGPSFRRRKRVSWVEKTFGAPHVHNGFQNAYLSVQAQILDVVFEALRSELRVGRKIRIYTTGHSLGGALATICAFDLASRFPGLKITEYTYGQPRVGNHEFANALNKLVPSNFRLVCEGDLVSTMPKLLFLYKHAGIEILIDKRGNCVVDPTFVEKKMKPVGHTVSDHYLAAYKISLEKLALLHPEDRSYFGQRFGIEFTEQELTNALEEDELKYSEEKHAFN